MSRETVQFAEMVRAAYHKLPLRYCPKCKRPLHFVNRIRGWVCARCELKEFYKRPLKEREGGE